MPGGPCSARRARSGALSLPSGSTSFSKRASAARRAGAVRAERSSVFAHEMWAAMRARRTRCEGVRLLAAVDRRIATVLGPGRAHVALAAERLDVRAAFSKRRVGRLFVQARSGRCRAAAALWQRRAAVPLRGRRGSAACLAAVPAPGRESRARGAGGRGRVPIRRGRRRSRPRWVRAGLVPAHPQAQAAKYAVRRSVLLVDREVVVPSGSRPRG